METQNKDLSARYYMVETRDDRHGLPEHNYWDWTELDRRDTLADARELYEQLLLERDSLRLVQVTHTTLAQSYQTPSFIRELEQSLSELEGLNRKYLVKVLKGCSTRRYACDVPLTNGHDVTEVFIDLLEQIKVIVSDGQSYYPCGFGTLSTKDQLAIIKTIANN